MLFSGLVAVVFGCRLAELEPPGASLGNSGVGHGVSPTVQRGFQTEAVTPEPSLFRAPRGAAHEEGPEPIEIQGCLLGFAHRLDDR